MEKPSGRAPVMVAMLLIAGAYVLAFGPAIYLRDTGHLPESILGVIYFPLFLLGECFTACGDALDWYAGFWHPG